MEFNNTTLLYGLFNQYVFSEAKMNLNYLRMYYQDKYILDSKPIVAKLLNLIEVYNYKDLTESRFLLTFQEDGKSVDEANMLYSKIKEYRSYSKEQAGVFTENLRNMCYSAYIERCRRRYEDNPVGYAEAIKKFDYKSNYSDTLVAKNFSELDVTDLVDRYSSVGYKSRYQFINDSYSSGGYVPGQLVAVCGAPGCFTDDTKLKVRLKGTNEIIEKSFLELSKSEVSKYEVLSYDCYLQKYTWNSINKVIDNGVKSDLVKIEFDDDSIVISTADHLYLTLNGYIKAKDLTESDEIISYE